MIMTRAVATSSHAVSPELISDPSAAAAGPAARARMTGAAVTAARVRLRVDRVLRMHPPWAIQASGVRWCHPAVSAGGHGCVDGTGVDLRFRSGYTSRPECCG